MFEFLFVANMKRSTNLMTALIASILLFTIQTILSGQDREKIRSYDIDVTPPGKKIIEGNLKVGGINSRNESIKVNNFYFLINDKPFIPVTGEFHFSRYPDKYWGESLRKMKAGGINIIATYVFWNIHEEHEGIFNWEGDKDLRKFIGLCAKNDFKVIVRIGPYCHGEIRNGGLPDWLFARPFSVRSNDPEYLFYVERLYSEISKQLHGFFFKDGGPVIGIQLENEYQHSASPWALTYPGQPIDWTVADRDRALVKEGVSVAEKDNPYAQFGKEHMRVLKALAENAGIIVPIYTATGWGNAAVIENESIPVTAAYPYPTWVPTTSLSSFYLYTDLQKKPDYSPVRYKPDDYPYFPAEIGGGMTNNYSRRPTIPPESLDALINRFLGSGSNGLGYYMYHGGATPSGDKYFFSDEAYAYPKINYDYQAPVGQYGQISESFHRLKLIHFFLNSFGDMLAPMSVYLPETNTGITPDDTVTLRYAVRSKEGSGFIFINNFQDNLKMGDKESIQFKIKTTKGEIIIPESAGFFLKSEENLILPFNMDIGGVNLNYATAQLLTVVGPENSPCYIFFYPEDLMPEFSFSKTNITRVAGESCKISSDKNRWLVRCSGTSDFRIRKKDGREVRILLMEKSMACKSWIVNIKRENYLIVSDALFLEGKNSFEFYSSGNNVFDFYIYPKISFELHANEGSLTDITGEDQQMSKFRIRLPESRFDLKIERYGENKLQLNLPEFLPDGLSDIFIRINYIGDTGMCFMNGELVDDQFFYGQPWIVGLKKFYDLPQHSLMNFYFRPMYSNASYLVDLKKESIPDFKRGQSYIKINDIATIPEYHGTVNF
jgi:beta-galactosidase